MSTSSADVDDLETYDVVVPDRKCARVDSESVSTSSSVFAMLLNLFRLNFVFDVVSGFMSSRCIFRLLKTCRPLHRLSIGFGSACDGLRMYRRSFLSALDARLISNFNIPLVKFPFGKPANPVAGRCTIMGSLVVQSLIGDYWDADLELYCDYSSGPYVHEQLKDIGFVLNDSVMFFPGNSTFVGSRDRTETYILKCDYDRCAYLQMSETVVVVTLVVGPVGVSGFRVTNEDSSSSLVRICFMFLYCVCCGCYPIFFTYCVIYIGRC